jgi:hypothetical protein
MISELEEFRMRFEVADKQLDEMTISVREKYGISDDLIEREYQRFLDAHEGPRQ